MKKAIVTGAAGFVGGHMVDRLIDDGWEVIAIDDFSTGNYKNPKAKWYPDRLGGDIKSGLLSWVRSSETYKADLDGATVMFHFAATARIPASLDNPEQYYKNNILSTIDVLEFCTAHKIKLVFSSSSSVEQPDNPYAHSKVISEEMCEMYSKIKNLDVQCLRYFNVYGPRMAGGSYATVMEKFKTARLRKMPIPVIGDGSQKRDFTYVQDVVDANLLMLNVKGFRVFDVGSNNPISIKEIAELYARPKHGDNEKSVFNKYRILYNQHGYRGRDITCADIAPLREIGYEPKGDVIRFIKEVHLVFPTADEKYEMYREYMKKPWRGGFMYPRHCHSCGADQFEYITEADARKGLANSGCYKCNQTFVD